MPTQEVTIKVLSAVEFTEEEWVDMIYEMSDKVDVIGIEIEEV